MPYRIDIADPDDEGFNRLVELGALDVDLVDGRLAAVMPDTVDISEVMRAVGGTARVTPARGRDAGSVWVVQPRGVRVGRFEFIPARRGPRAGALRMIDGPAFGTGLHASTALCLEAMDAAISGSPPRRVLDVGTGSGILALAALAAGAPVALGVDLDHASVRVAAENARLNGLSSRLWLVQGGPESLSGTWPLVLANVLAAPLVALAPLLARRVEHGGRLILSGVRSSLAREVEAAYVHVGMQTVGAASRDEWTAMTFHPSW